VNSTQFNNLNKKLASLSEDILFLKEENLQLKDRLDRIEKVNLISKEVETKKKKKNEKVFSG
jgi:regulator of replication initiation timing